ncbi:HAD family hydrolase [Brachybacterium saurashtrense]|uniref:HAD family hydrolase n=1 Tax=Brachybacterium saurashtrense TaxID=556288 RepID=A0A345YT53_9MICO|nr:HAD hydrolase family protein [Brachybacterium saurashtrense]AXK47105.1 HAD family hydrolase [Brachybacterium saurashtrense]RRR21376.1 HAD family hydrolase [Brachybacterium saurashtrense]RRR23428.1 HAD family hydrolase [Brachybacterium saurashtrense]
MTAAATATTRERLEAHLSALSGTPLLIGLDVDGTLVDHDGVMSPPMHRALQRAAEEHTVVIATGRSLGATLPIVAAAGITRGYAVCSNGAVTIEMDPEAEGGHRLVDTRAFQPGRALRSLREVAPDAHYAVEMSDGTFRSTAGFQDASFGVEAIESDLDELMDLEAVRVVVHVPDLSPQEFSRVVAESGVHGVEYSIGWTAWLDMAAPGISKASALETLREQLGIDPAHTVAVGDGFNDLEMLTWAGVGVAMGQAPQGVKDVADVVTDTIYEDGTVLVLERIQR